LKYIGDKQYERVIKREKGKGTNKVSEINKSHMAAMLQMKIVPSADGWLFKSGIPMHLSTLKVNTESIKHNIN
jgi:hypothetical protein